MLPLNSLAYDPLPLKRTSTRFVDYLMWRRMRILVSPSVNVCRLASPRGLVVSNALGDVAKYLSEAATSIFKPTGGSDVPWDGSGTPFTG